MIVLLIRQRWSFLFSFLFVSCLYLLNNALFAAVYIYS
jgi:hypothetical protein